MLPKKLLLLLLPLVMAGCAQQHLVKGDRAYDSMAYTEATKQYELALRTITDRTAILKLADSYRKQNMLGRAVERYAEAAKAAPLTSDEALSYGRALQTLGRTSDAADQFARVIAERPEDPVVRELGLAIASRDVFYEDSTLFTVRPVLLEGMQSAFSAIPFGNGIFFAGEKAAVNAGVNPWNGASFIDIFTSEGTPEGAWSAPRPLPGEVNGRYHDGPAIISSDGKTMFFTRSDYLKYRLNKDADAVSHLMLFRAERNDDGSWGKIHSFAYNGADFSAGHAALSTDGNTLYYISDMPGGFGGTDIYACQRTEEGWGYPRNMGPTVNTSANEMFPTIKGDTLYFASNGHRSLGGLDIFRTTRIDDEWKKPENLNYPINTPFDDFALVMLPDGRNGYLSSNRSGTDRIYTFEANDPTLIVEGTFSDEEDRFLSAVEVRLQDITTGEDITVFTSSNGTYSLPLQKNHEYRIHGSKEGMYADSRPLSTAGQKTSRIYSMDFKLKAIVIEMPIVVENIYYDLDRWEIRPDAAIELDKIARICMDNPGLSFELGSHTDCRSKAMYNLLLSEQRAKSAVDYLIRQGVDPDRITATGYGETQLVNHCKDGVRCSEEEHQANRRTEFKVIKVLASAN